MTHNISGKFAGIVDIKSGTSKNGKEWRFGKLLLTVQDYKGAEKNLVFDVNPDRTPSPVEVGYEIDVCFALDSSEYNGKVYPKVNVVSISEKIVDASNMPKGRPAQAPAQRATSAFGAEVEDLPF